MTVNLTIDGKQVVVEGPATILEAAKQIGVEIPTFCYHPRLDIFGGCRMCLVEVEGWNKLETACTCRVSEGMVVYTDNEKVRKGRKAMLELLLVNHPLDCPVCDRSGDCDLQNLVFKYGSAETRFSGQKRVLPDRVVSPLIDRNVNRCIQCKRCVRICDEVQGVAALGMAHRGAKTVVVPFMDKVLDCELCGHCVYACPVGCVNPMPARHAARTWEMDKVRSICSFCSVGCTLDYNSRNDKVLKVSHSEDSGVNNGSLCSKGFFGYDAFNHADRITRPMVRREGTLQESTWEEALCAVADRFGRISDGDGGGLVGGIASARITNEDLYLFQKLMRVGFGTNNVDTSAGIWSRKVVPVLQKRLGVWAATNSIEELAAIDALLVVGCDITVSSPITGLKVKQALRKGASVTEINPSKSALSRLGTRSLTVPTGLEIALIKGMIQVILDEGLVDISSASAVRNFSELEKAVRGKDLAEIARECGVEKDQIVHAAREFAAAEKASLIFGETAALQPGGEDLLQTLLDLMILTGKTGKEGCGVYPILSATNFQGAVDMGVDPAWLPGRVAVSSQDGKENFGKAWGVQVPEKSGLNSQEMIQKASEGELKALYLVGVDLFSSFPGGSDAGDILEKMEFLVVQDLFLTETARRADVVLPAASMAEKSGSLTSLERRVQKVTKAVKETGSARPDWKIFSELGLTMGKQGMKYAAPEDILREIASIVPYYSGINNLILADGGAQWPCTGESGGTGSLLSEGVPEDRKSFASVSGWSTVEEDSEYPLTLVLGELLFHSGSFSRYSENLNKIVSSAYLLVNPLTASELDIRDESDVRISSRNGAVRVPVRYSEDLAPGMLFLPRHFADAPASELMVPDANGEPKTALINVRVERA
jgi:NADH-quinone oxidoreductase chain G